MSQRYRLRLGDGTVLVVDRDGLSTWLVDDGAMVQAVGSQRWRPLKQFLAQERVAARQALRLKPSDRDALPLVHSKPDEDEPPGAPSPDPVDMAAVPVAVPPPLEPGPIGEPLGVQALADEPAGPAIGPARSASPAVGGLPIIPLKPLEDEAAPRATVSTPSPAVEPAPIGEPLGVQALADEPAGPGVGPARTASPAVEGLPIIPLKPLEDEGLRRAAAPSWSHPLEPVSVRSSLPVRARDSGAFRTQGTWRTPTADNGHPSSRLRPLLDLDPSSFGAGIDDPEGMRERLLRSRLTGRLLRAARGLGSFLSRCLDPLNRLGGGAASFASLDEPMLLPDSNPVPSAAPERGVSARAMREIGVPAEDPLEARDPDVRKRSDEGPPILRLKPFVDVVSRSAATKLRRIRGRASAWVEGVTGRVGPVPRRDRPSPSVLSSERAVSSEPAASSPPGLEPRELLKPPPSLGELPVLRLAPVHEPKDPTDLYEGADLDEDRDTRGRVSLVHAVSSWTRRLVVVTGLVAGGIWVALSWETWTPKAAQLGGFVFTEIDGRVRARHQAERQELALQEARGQLPHLAPGTIELVLSSSPTGILGPPELFRLACDAADRGSAALTADEARELTSLRRQVLEALPPLEREPVRDYDRARARRVTFTFEDEEALRLFARGARALPSRSRERLRALLGKAVAAGLATEGVARARAER